LVDEILRRRVRTPIEGGDPARERVDEAVQLRVRKCPVDVSVSFRSIPVEVVRAENDFERAAAADQQWEAFRTTPPGFTPTPTSGWPSLAKLSEHLGIDPVLGGNHENKPMPGCHSNPARPQAKNSHGSTALTLFGEEPERELGRVRGRLLVINGVGG
jgi:hypothetical protein